MGKVNYSLDLFLAHIYAIYDNLKKEFKIEVDTVKPFDIKDKKAEELLREYTLSISTFKQKEGNEIIGSATIDAENILWIEKKRNNKSQNIFDTKYFFISTDQSLRRWDYQREDKTPIVLLPSQWMSILLRYLNRTEDDFKSFVSFLNLKNNEVLINSERLHVVLAGISEMTTNIEQQQFIFDNLVENKFKDIISEDSTNEQIFENVKMFAKSKLENEVEKLKKQNKDLVEKHEKLSLNMAEHQTTVAGDIQKLQEETQKNNKALIESRQENKHLKDSLAEKEFEKWQNTAKWLVCIGVLIIIFTILQFCWQSWEYNFPYYLIKKIDELDSDTQKNTLRALMYSPLIGLCSIIKMVWGRLFSRENKERKKDTINENLNKKFVHKDNG